eukprot:1695898-Pleurochrysis_carterae.AAC.3
MRSNPTAPSQKYALYLQDGSKARDAAAVSVQHAFSDTQRRCIRISFALGRVSRPVMLRPAMSAVAAILVAAQHLARRLLDLGPLVGDAKQAEVARGRVVCWKDLARPRHGREPRVRRRVGGGGEQQRAQRRHGPRGQRAAPAVLRMDVCERGERLVQRRARAAVLVGERAEEVDRQRLVLAQQARRAAAEQRQRAVARASHRDGLLRVASQRRRRLAAQHAQQPHEQMRARRLEQRRRRVLRHPLRQLAAGLLQLGRRVGAEDRVEDRLQRRGEVRRRRHRAREVANRLHTHCHTRGATLRLRVGGAGAGCSGCAGQLAQHEGAERIDDAGAVDVDLAELTQQALGQEGDVAVRVARADDQVRQRLCG